MTKVFITGPDDIEVGDIIHHRIYEWLVISIQPDGRFSTRHRETGSKGDFSNHMEGWTWKAFEGENYHLTKGFKQFKYDPEQTGDRDDDI